jgi:hypothetical protein
MFSQNVRRRLQYGAAWQWAHRMYDVCWANAHFITKTKKAVKKNRRYRSLANR